MDINELLQGVNCECGKKHTCNIKYVYIEKNAAARLQEICAQYQNILLVADENTFAAAGQSTIDNLQGKNIEKVIFPGDQVLVPNEAAIAAVEEVLGQSELIIAIGSGVIQDLCKYVSFDKKVPYIDVATAPSMDGYASDGAAMILGGMKETCKVGLPLAIIADTAVLAGAPMEMLKAGYGDVVGKFSALNDWKLSRLLNDEYYCQYIYDLTYQQIQQTLALADGILKRNEESVKTLMEALVVIGILMSFAGSSRPASGSEHHLSHFFEITGIVDGTPYLSHGIDVAYSTVITAQIREKILANPFPKQIFREEKQQYEQNVRKIYKEVADGCMALQQKVGNYAKDRSADFLAKEAQIREILAEMPTADEVKEMLARAELDISEFYELYGEEKIKNAILYAKELKDRYTVLWVNYDFYGGE